MEENLYSGKTVEITLWIFILIAASEINRN